jgi:hypothetical protein
MSTPGFTTRRIGFPEGSGSLTLKLSGSLADPGAARLPLKMDDLVRDEPGLCMIRLRWIGIGFRLLDPPPRGATHSQAPIAGLGGIDQEIEQNLVFPVGRAQGQAGRAPAGGQNASAGTDTRGAASSIPASSPNGRSLAKTRSRSPCLPSRPDRFIIPMAGFYRTKCTLRPWRGPGPGAILVP